MSIQKIKSEDSEDQMSQERYWILRNYLVSFEENKTDT